MRLRLSPRARGGARQQPARDGTRACPARAPARVVAARPQLRAAAGRGAPPDRRSAARARSARCGGCPGRPPRDGGQPAPTPRPYERVATPVKGARPMIRRLALIAVLALSATALFATQASAAKQLVFCSDVSYPPEEFVQSGKPVGSDIDIAANVAKRLGMTSKIDRKSTRLNSSHVAISYAVFCLKKKKIRFNNQVNLSA